MPHCEKACRAAAAITCATQRGMLLASTGNKTELVVRLRPSLPTPRWTSSEDALAIFFTAAGIRNTLVTRAVAQKSYGLGDDALEGLECRDNCSCAVWRVWHVPVPRMSTLKDPMLKSRINGQCGMMRARHGPRLCLNSAHPIVCAAQTGRVGRRKAGNGKLYRVTDVVAAARAKQRSQQCIGQRLERVAAASMRRTIKKEAQQVFMHSRRWEGTAYCQMGCAHHSL